MSASISPSRRPARHLANRIVATCSMGAWFLLAATPLIVVVCALKG